VLVELMVENYAVIERLRVRFHAGLNVLTGETGSGKSIVVDALGLLFGGRTSADMLRSGTDRARISGIFEAPASAHGLLESAGIELEDGELLLEREILAGGKSRAFAANRPCTAALLRDLSRHLGDIHGQHDQQQLFDTRAQRVILDSFAGNADLLSQVEDVFRRWKDCGRQLDELDRTEQEKLRLLDMWTFQRNEIESARLKPGEDADLESERKILQNVTRLLDTANSAYSFLYDAPESAYAQIRQAVRRVEELCKIDDSLRAVLDSLKPAEIAVAEASGELRDYLGKLEADPDRLESIESRLAAIEKLKRKYGSTVEEILAFFETVQAQIAAVETAADRRAALVREKEQLSAQFEALAGKLHDRRTDAARKLERKVETELKSLAMERTVFRVDLNPAEWTEYGADSVTFLVSANVGEEPRPLEKVASGGELSRIALALKACVIDRQSRTLVFDEVDAGIGGAAAEMVGKRLKQIAKGNQVLCVTHLAQIAGFGDHHFVVEKREAKGRTTAAIEELAGDARTREIGRMLSGHNLTPEALKHAEQLIR
jgi:DNA repair protein RecN (Recombination protein N)